MNAFVDGLASRAGLFGVQVSSGYLGADSDAYESIQLVDVSPANQQWSMIGNKRRDEEYTLQGIIWVVQAGKGETVIRAARDRVFALLAEIEDFLRVDPTIGSTTRVSELSAYPLEQGANDRGRWCQISFEVSCKKDLRSS